MKKTLTLMIVTLTLLSCSAQIIPLNNAHVDIPYGAYLKDTDNFLDNFAGTWQYSLQNETFTIKLQKVLHYNYDSFYSDILVGEYSYTDAAGNEIINTLSSMDNSALDPLYHNIGGAMFKMKLEFPACTECNNDEFRVKMYFQDPERKNIPMAMYLRSLSPTQIKIYLRLDGHPLGIGAGDPTYIRVPIKECIMTKI